MEFTDFLAAVIAFVITLALFPVILPLLRKLKFGQFVRDDGPETHLAKAGTPTMGGIIFLAGFIIASAVFVKSTPQIIPIIFMTAGFGLIGFCDDYLKVVKKRSLGLKAIQKLILQLLLATVFFVYLYFYSSLDTNIIIPFFHGMQFDLGFLYLPFAIIVILGTVNGTNLTDGIDGLATTVTIVVVGFLIFASQLLGTKIIPSAAALLGALLGFLIFNWHPAKIFMGDTGSLAIGGFVATTALMLKIPLFILLFGIIYLLESISVILQVGYYKKTQKRIFKMAPIHHHFEKSGWNEVKVVVVFTLITIFFSIIALYAL